jgi:hypothetical protein
MPKDPEKSEEFEPSCPEGWDERFAKQDRGIRQILQAIEDALIDAGYDDLVVTTEHGTFR